jgi:hypothetical protein
MSRWVLLVVALGGSSNAAATTVVALSEDELIRRADTIVVATVINTQTVVKPGGFVVTRAAVQVHRGIRGAVPNKVIFIEVPGGELPGGLVAHTSGSPKLASGDMLFGFLETHERVRRPLGLSFGLLRVRVGPDGQHKVYRDTAGLALVRAAGQHVAPESVAIRDLPLEEMIGRVEARMRELSIPLRDKVTP